MSGSGYQLYVGNDCNSCDKIITFIEGKGISISIINIDNEDYNLPFSLMVIPALVREDKLIGYGPDIQEHLELNCS